MKKIVLKFGLIAGAIMAALMLLSMKYQHLIGFDHSLIVGYTTMLIAFLMIYFGVRSYRDTVGGGRIGFGRALAVALLIGGVASLCYVAVWEVYFYAFAPDFMQKYNAHVIETARAHGESAEALARRKAELDRFAELYKNPLVNAGMTILEPLPVALLVSLVSAGLLSRRRKPDTVADDVFVSPSASVTQ